MLSRKRVFSLESNIAHWATWYKAGGDGLLLTFRSRTHAQNLLRNEEKIQDDLRAGHVQDLSRRRSHPKDCNSMKLRMSKGFMPVAFVSSSVKGRKNMAPPLRKAACLVVLTIRPDCFVLGQSVRWTSLVRRKWLRLYGNTLSDTWVNLKRPNKAWVGLQNSSQNRTYDIYIYFFLRLKDRIRIQATWIDQNRLADRSDESEVESKG